MDLLTCPWAAGAAGSLDFVGSSDLAGSSTVDLAAVAVGEGRVLQDQTVTTTWSRYLRAAEATLEEGGAGAPSVTAMLRLYSRRFCSKLGS